MHLLYVLSCSCFVPHNREYCGGIGATWEIKLHSRQQIPSGRVWIPTDAVATREVTPGHFCHHLRIFKDSKVITTVHFLHHLWNQDIIQDVYEFVKKEWDDFMHSFFPFFNTTSITILVVVMKNDKGARVSSVCEGREDRLCISSAREGRIRKWWRGSKHPPATRQPVQNLSTELQWNSTAKIAQLHLKALPKVC